ncbi:hypothetical protein ACS7SF_09840 [Ralstonia sp. 25C]|uniref:hypothetical protein n=1 Tax=Ralstonia sp. 25C TaxID=3447363 RepID=UPI003F75428C
MAFHTKRNSAQKARESNDGWSELRNNKSLRRVREPWLIGGVVVATAAFFGTRFMLPRHDLSKSKIDEILKVALTDKDMVPILFEQDDSGHWGLGANLYIIRW